MPQRLRSRRLLSRLVPLVVAVGLGMFAAPSAGAITSAECAARVNDTPGKLLPCIHTDDLWAHMRAFQAIADAIPVAFTTFAVGQDLLNQYQQAVQNGTALPVMSIDIEAIVNPNADDYNVIAESKGGDKNHVVVVDAHLDAIYGAGMLDNASGSATILDIAQMMKNVTPRNKLRFIWFGGEELGSWVPRTTSTT